jgi:hypothetical protein
MQKSPIDAPDSTKTEMSSDETPRAEAGGAPRSLLSGHGQPRLVPIDALLGADPDLWLAMANMRAWSEAHPCECEALCECE